MAESARSPNAVVINEVLAHSHATAPDWIELYNTTAADIDISNWYLSDSATNVRKYRIAAGTILPAHGYYVFYENTQFNNPADTGALVPFSLSEDGDDTYISSGDASGSLTGYRQGISFDGTDSNVSIGRYTRSTGDVVYTRLSAQTPGAANASPSVGPVVINEVMYHPAPAYDEYIELLNVSDGDVPLYDPLTPANTWRFTAGIDYTFPLCAVIPAHAYALVVTTDPAAFRAKYAIPANIQIFGGPDIGALDNAGETITLSAPFPPDGPAVPFYTVDSLAYGNNAPWSITADGDGPSLSRLSTTVFGNDVVNWTQEGSGSPGLPNFITTIAGLPAGNNAWFVSQSGGNIEVRSGSAGGPLIGTYPVASLNGLLFTGGTGSDAITITSPLSISPALRGGTGNDTITVLAGSYTLDPGTAATNAALALVVGPGIVNISSSQTFASINLNSGGRVNVDAGGKYLIRTGGLNIAAGGVMDLGQGDLVLSYAGATPVDTIRQNIFAGRLITSAGGTAGAYATLAQVDNNMIRQTNWSGTPINNGADFNQVIITHAYMGDTNLDGQVTQADYYNVIANQGHTGSQWIGGDLNHDGIVTADDLAQISANMGAGSAAGFGPQLAVAAPAAPVAAKSAAPKAKTVAVKKIVAHAKPHKPAPEPRKHK